jgi:hypothetical protein
VALALLGQAVQFMPDMYEGTLQVHLPPLFTEVKAQPNLQLHFPLVTVPSKKGSLVVEHAKHLLVLRIIALTLASQIQLFALLDQIKLLEHSQVPLLLT